MAVRTGAIEQAGALYERALILYDAVGEAHAAARVSASLAYVEQVSGHVDRAVERMERAYEAIAGDEPTADMAYLLSRLGSSLWFSGNTERAMEYNERGLDIAEALQVAEPLCRGWMTKAVIVTARRPEESRALFQLALDTALRTDNLRQAGVALASLSDLGFHRDRYASSLRYLEQSIELARRIGERRGEWFVLSEMTYALTMLGRWDEALARLAEIPEERLTIGANVVSPLTGVLEVHLHRGRLDEARALLSRYGKVEELAGSVDLQTLGCYRGAVAAVRLAEGDARAALLAAEDAYAGHPTLGFGSQDVKQGLTHALEAALALGDRDKVQELLEPVEALPVGLRPPLLTALAHRFRAHLANAGAEADDEFSAASTTLRDLELPFHLAVAQLEHGEWLVAQGRPGDAEEILTEAQETFEHLGATAYAERAAAAAPARHKQPA